MDVKTYNGRIETSDKIDNETVAEFEFTIRKDVVIPKDLYNYGTVKIVENSDFPLVIVCDKQVGELDSRLQLKAKSPLL